MKNPLVSILISCFNEENSIKNSLISIINQSYKKIEIIIIDDGSTDNTYNILKQFQKIDKRILLFKRINYGLTNSLNFGVEKCNGFLIARNDSGDISHLDRIKYQVEFFQKKPDTILLGTRVRELRNNKYYTWKDFKLKNLNKFIIRQNIFAHSSVMFKKNTFLEVGGYNEKFIVSQDYELWLRMSKKGNIYLLNKILLTRVWSNNSISSKKKFQQLLNSIKARFIHCSPNQLPQVFISSLYQFCCTIIPFRFLKMLKKLFLR